MKYRTLSKNALMVSTVGLGCMGMSEFYGRTNYKGSISLIKKAYELGVNFFDTADVYGYGDNEKLVGDAVKSFRNKIIIATKCGIIRKKEDPNARGIDGAPKYIKICCEDSLRRLQTDYIDLYYLHRIDSNIPIEESITAMADLVREGKVKHIGLSEASAETIRKAQSIYPLTAIQSEYSLWSRSPEKDVLSTCRELGIGFVPYSPIGRGFLSGKITSIDSLDENDFRRLMPRFQPENLLKNLTIVEKIAFLAKKKHCTSAQLALAWVLSQGEDIVPIPGTKQQAYLEENIAAQTIMLDRDDLEYLSNSVVCNKVSGERYAPEMMKIYNFSE